MKFGAMARKTNRSKKTPKASPNPVALFNHASTVYGADRELRDIKQPVNVTAVAAGSMILNAFACELFLKCVLALENTPDPAIAQSRDAISPDQP